MARNTEKLIMHTLGPRKLKKKTWKMRNTHFKTWNMARKPKKLEKCDTNNVLPGRWQETLTNVEYEKCTLQDLEYGKKPEKGEK